MAKLFWRRTLTGTKTPDELMSYMSKNIRYSDFTRLKKPREVLRQKSGSCHDQTVLELKL